MATIIKSGVRTGGGRVIHTQAFNLMEMSEHADQYLEQVRGQAAQILDDAREQATQIRARAEQEGREAAMQAVEKMICEKLEKELGTLLPALREAIKGVRQAKDDWLSHWERAAVGVAGAMAECVIRRELVKTPEITLELVSEALQISAGNGQLKLYMNPGDLDALRGQIEQLVDQLGLVVPTEFLPDPEVSQGGCRVESEFGKVDHQIESQLERIAEELA